MCAFTASRSEKTQSRIKRLSGWQAGGGFSTLAGQKMDEWGWASVLVDIMATLVFRRALCCGISALIP